VSVLHRAAGAAGAAVTGVSCVDPPLLAVAPVDQIDALTLRTHAHPDHLAPGDVLPGARSVISLFLPFRRPVVAAARRARPDVSRVWAEAYTEGNRAVEAAGAAVAALLREAGFETVVRPPTADFDETSLMSVWSHKHVAVLAGLARFGRSCQAITPAGCAGRLGSVLTRAALDPHTPSTPPRCEDLCGDRAPCRRNCPAGALPGLEGPIERRACWERLLDNEARFPDLPAAQVCGICAVAACARL